MATKAELEKENAELKLLLSTEQAQVGIVIPDALRKDFLMGYAHQIPYQDDEITGVIQVTLLNSRAL